MRCIVPRIPVLRSNLYRNTGSPEVETSGTSYLLSAIGTSNLQPSRLPDSQNCCYSERIAHRALHIAVTCIGACVSNSAYRKNPIISRHPRFQSTTAESISGLLVASQGKVSRSPGLQVSRFPVLGLLARAPVSRPRYILLRLLLLLPWPCLFDRPEDSLFLLLQSSTRHQNQTSIGFTASYPCTST